MINIDRSFEPEKHFIHIGKYKNMSLEHRMNIGPGSIDHESLKKCDEIASLFEREGLSASNRRLDEIELAFICHVLKKCGFNRHKAAKELGIGLRTLQRKLISAGLKEVGLYVVPLKG